MPTGKVKWYNEQRGFGYVQPDEGGPDVFVHRSVIQPEDARPLSEGQAVDYELEAGPKGPRAVSLRCTGSSRMGQEPS